MQERKQYLLIIDGSSLLATSYYSTLPKVIRKEKDEEKKKEMFPKLLPKDKKGRYINALQQFFHTLFTILNFQRPSHLVICWDVSRNTFRKDLWPLYKSNRSETPGPLKEQFQTAIEVCDKLGIVQYQDQAFEADDFAGTLATLMEPYMDVRILTRDKDYFQLISNKTRIWYGMADLAKVKEWRKKHNMAPLLPSKVVEIDRYVCLKEFNYTPEALPMIKALFGDVSDNIPGVSGMGENRSIRMAMRYHSPSALEKDLDRAVTKAAKAALRKKWQTWGITKSPYSCLVKKATEHRKSAREMLELCYELGKIKTDINLDQYTKDPFHPDLLRYRFNFYQVEKILNEYSIELNVRRVRTSGHYNQKKQENPLPVQGKLASRTKGAPDKNNIQSRRKPPEKSRSAAPAPIRKANRSKQKKQSAEQKVSKLSLEEQQKKKKPNQKRRPRKKINKQPVPVDSSSRSAAMASA